MARNHLFLLRWVFGGGFLLAMIVTLVVTQRAYADGVVDIKTYKHKNAKGETVTVNAGGIVNRVTIPIVGTQNDIVVFVAVNGKQAGDTCNAMIVKDPGGTPIDLSPNVTGVAGGFNITIPANTMAQNTNWNLLARVRRGMNPVGDDTNNIAIPPPE